jgi:hypothetical protein
VEDQEFANPFSTWLPLWGTFQYSVYIAIAMKATHSSQIEEMSYSWGSGTASQRNFHQPIQMHL